MLTKKTIYLCFIFIIWDFVNFPSRLEAYNYIIPSLSVSQEYNDNIYLTKKDKTSDWITSITPSISYVLNKKGLNARLTYSPSLRLYAKENVNNEVQHTLTSSALWKVSKRIEVSVYGNFLRNQEQFISLSGSSQLLGESPDYTLRRHRKYHSKFSGGAIFRYRFSKKSLIYVGYKHIRTWESDPTIEESARLNPVAGVFWDVGSHFFLKIDASFTRGHFFGDSEDIDIWKTDMSLIKNFSRHFSSSIGYSHTILQYRGDSPGYKIYNPWISASYKYDKYSSLEAQVGYYLRDVEKGDNESGVSMQINLNKKWKLKRGKIEGKITSGYKETYFGGENLGFTIFFGTRASFLYGLSRHLTNELSFDYRVNRYTQLSPERRDKILLVDDTLSYRLNKWVRFSLGYGLRKLDSNINQNDFTENRVVFSIVFSRSYRTEGD